MKNEVSDTAFGNQIKNRRLTTERLDAEFDLWFLAPHYTGTCILMKHFKMSKTIFGNQISVVYTSFAFCKHILVPDICLPFFRMCSTYGQIFVDLFPIIIRLLHSNQMCKRASRLWLRRVQLSVSRQRKGSTHTATPTLSTCFHHHLAGHVSVKHKQEV